MDGKKDCIRQSLFYVRLVAHVSPPLPESFLPIAFFILKTENEDILQDAAHNKR